MAKNTFQNNIDRNIKHSTSYNTILKHGINLGNNFYQNDYLLQTYNTKWNNNLKQFVPDIQKNKQLKKHTKINAHYKNKQKQYFVFQNLNKNFIWWLFLTPLSNHSNMRQWRFEENADLLPSWN